LESFKQFLDRGLPILLTTHENPDADGLSAQLAVHCILEQFKIQTFICNGGPLPEKYKFMDPKKVLTDIKNQNILPHDYDVIVLDTSDIGHISKEGQECLNNAQAKFFIDHHNGPNPSDTFFWIDPEKSSTAEMVFDLAKALKVKLPLHVCKALFAGIVYDTGSFIYPKTTAHTFQIASSLVKKGVKPKEIHSLLYENKPISSFKLLALIQSTFEVYLDNRVAVQIMEKEMLQRSGATYESAENIINYPLKSPQILVSLFFKEDAKGVWRCSIRSKGEIDVASFALTLGGGGHKNAAGFPLPSGDLDEVMKTVLASIEESLF